LGWISRLKQEVGTGGVIYWLATEIEDCSRPELTRRQKEFSSDRDSTMVARAICDQSCDQGEISAKKHEQGRAELRA
jgi:hypothetical protein